MINNIKSKLIVHYLKLLVLNALQSLIVQKNRLLLVEK